MKTNTINIYSILFNSVLFCIYILPVYEFEKIGVSIDKYIFLFVVMSIYFFLIIKEKKVTLIEIAIFLFSIIFSYYRKEISFLHIISIALMYKILKRDGAIYFIRRIILNSKFVYLCLLFVLFYSVLYFGKDGRYLYSSIGDPNMSGLAIFSLFSMIYVKNKSLGRLLLTLGLLTFSKSYLVALLLFCIFEFLSYKGINIDINYLLLSIIVICILLVLSSIFIELDKMGKIQQYVTGVNRFFIFFDYSNYYRFTVNTNVLNIYLSNPDLLFGGISNNDFFAINARYCAENNVIFFRIRPHNYFFAYLQIYGIWSLVIFYYTYKVFKLVLIPDNNKISLPIFFYLIFLGMGASNYWLYLSLFTLIAYINFEN